MRHVTMQTLRVQVKKFVIKCILDVIKRTFPGNEGLGIKMTNGNGK